MHKGGRSVLPVADADRRAQCPPRRGMPAVRSGALAALALLGPAERGRSYAVLQKQNVVLLGSILSALLLTIILMAICVYKPVRRR